METDLRCFSLAAPLVQAWAVMVSSFLCNGIIFSILNSYGVIFVSLKEMYEKENLGDAATR